MRVVTRLHVSKPTGSVRLCQVHACGQQRPGCRQVVVCQAHQQPEASVQKRRTVQAGAIASDVELDPVQLLERSLQLPAGAASASKRRTLEAPEELRSTWGHRAWVASAAALLGAVAAQGCSELHGWGDLGGGAAAVLLAYVLSDFATAVYHWSVDNYGSGATPIVGDQIAAFQGHHQRPWTITEREFANNVHKVFKPTVPFSVLGLLISHWTPGSLDIGMATFISLVAMSQQFHAWAHMKRTELPRAVVALQEAGVLVSRRAHGAHHRAPFEGNYAIVSGAWNTLLDSTGFFRQCEHWIADRTGVEPRCWSEPHYEVEERPEQ